jgi:hypothetical protein
MPLARIHNKYSAKLLIREFMAASYGGWPSLVLAP